MIKHVFSVFFASVLLLFAPINATVTSCQNSTLEAVIIHINGINTTLEEANKNLEKLKIAKESRSITNPTYLAYNWSYAQYLPWITGGIVDALDATIQGLLSAGEKSSTVYLASGNDLNVWDDGISRRIAGSIFVDQFGNIAGVQ